MVFVDPGCQLLKNFLALYLSYLTIVTERENPANKIFQIIEFVGGNFLLHSSSQRRIQ